MRKRLETEIRREQIAEAALNIVSEEGVGGLTVRKVAKKVGFSAPALYRHFKNKSEILLAAMEEHFSSSFSLLAQALRLKTPLETLRSYYFGYMRLIHERHSAIRIFTSEFVMFCEPRLLESAERFRDVMHNNLVRVIQEGQEIGLIRKDIGVEELYIHYLGIFITPDLLYSYKENFVDLDKQAESSWALFCDAVTV